MLGSSSLSSRNNTCINLIYIANTIIIMKIMISSLGMLLIALSIQPLSLASPEYNPQPELISAPSLITGGAANNIEIKIVSEPEPVVLSEDFLLFREIFDEIKNNYIDEISDQDLIQNAIKGMLSNLDPHSTYYSAEDFQRIKNQTSGSFAGIGISFNYDVDKKALLITKVFRNSPAATANIEVDDYLFAIDEIPVSDLDIQKSTKLLQGEVGSTVSLTLQRGDQTLDITIMRDNIKMPSLSNMALYNNEFAYIQLDRFQTESDKEIIEALTSLESEAQLNQSTIRGVILDLRDNSGGLLSASAEVADLFIDEGIITYTTGQAEKHQKQYHATKGDIIAGIPLVVLINAQSASGAEIVAGALQDHKRAVIMGENSYGKGSVQYAVGLTNGQAIRYTVARYFTPNGRSIQTLGIMPDIIIPSIKANVVKGSNQPREINRKGHLVNHRPDQSATRQPANFTHIINSDYPLYESLNILRAMSAFPQK